MKTAFSLLTAATLITASTTAYAESIKFSPYDIDEKKPPSVRVSGAQYKMLHAPSVDLGLLGTVSIEEEPIRGQPNKEFQGEKITAQLGVPAVQVDVKTSIIEMSVDTRKDLQKLQQETQLAGPPVGVSVKRDLEWSTTGTRSFVGLATVMKNPLRFIKYVANNEDDFKRPGSPNGCYKGLITNPKFRFVSAVLTVNNFTSEQVQKIKSSSDVGVNIAPLTTSRQSADEVDETVKVKLADGTTIGYVSSAVCFDENGNISHIAEDKREFRAANRTRRPRGCDEYDEPRICRR